MSDSLVFTSVGRITSLPDEKPSSALSSEVEIEASAMSTWIKQVIHFLKILKITIITDLLATVTATAMSPHIY